MSDSSNSLSVLQSVAAQQATQPQSSTGAPTSSLDVLNSVAQQSTVKMVGPKGTTQNVARNSVDAMRSQNWMVSPDAGQKMITPKGQVTYALPDEVDKFKASGHTLINPDGTFSVMPLDGEDNLDTMERAKRVIKSMTREERQKAMDAEIHPYDPRPVSSGGSGLKGAGRLAIHGVVAPAVAGTATMGALIGGSEAIAGAQAGLTALGETEAGQLFSSSPRLYAEYLMKQGIKGVAKYAMENKIGTAIVLDQLAKVLGIQKSTVLHKLISAGGSAITE